MLHTRAGPLFLMGALWAALAGAQEFDVAAIKPGSGQLRFQFQAGGRFTAENVPLGLLVQQAFGLQARQVVGPAWVSSVGFDIQAKGAELSTQADVQRMLAALLVERFGLKFHREQREMSYFALAVKDAAKTRGKIGAARTDEPHAFWLSFAGPGLPNTVFVQNHTMTQFAGRIGPTVDRVVVDETGLTGNFTIKIEGPQDEVSGNPFAVAWGATLNEIGLKLDSRRGPVEVYVIDDARLPSEN